MKYNIETLKKMVDNYTMNIEMFQSYYSIYENAQDPEVRAYKIRNNDERIAEMVGNRRLVAAMIENNGEAVVPAGYNNGNIFFDSMLYSAQGGADTSWWG